MIELTKISANKVHKLFKLLKKLDLNNCNSTYDSVDEAYNAWKYAERHELKKK